MSIPRSLVNELVNTMTAPKEDTKKKTIAYGTLQEVNGQKLVKLDGSEHYTPVTEALGAEDGDRVAIEIVNHKAIVTGNFTEPPSSRYATGYLKTINGGMLVGDIKDGAPVGNYLIVKNDRILICNQDSKVMASFNGSDIELGNLETGSIRFCNNAVSLIVDNNGSASIFSDHNSIHIRSQSVDGYDFSELSLFQSDEYGEQKASISVGSTINNRDRTEFTISNRNGVRINGQRIMVED